MINYSEEGGVYVLGWINAIVFLDVGTPETYEQANN